MGIILAIIIFSIIIIIHEFGHFLLAKQHGIRVNEFAVGMGPKVFSFQKGDTVYAQRHRTAPDQTAQNRHRPCWNRFPDSYYFPDSYDQIHYSYSFTFLFSIHTLNRPQPKKSKTVRFILFPLFDDFILSVKCVLVVKTMLKKIESIIMKGSQTPNVCLPFQRTTYFPDFLKIINLLKI